MPLIESITEMTNTGKGRAANAVVLSQNAKTFKNVLEGVKAAGTSTVTNTTASGLEAIFQKAARTYGISENILKTVAKYESDFKTTAVSKAGAMGIMQLMPATAKSLGVTDPFDPEQNIMGGAKLLASNLKEFGGDLKLALAAYNAGSGAVRKYGGVPPYEETQNYVKNIMGDLEKNSSIDISSVIGDSVSTVKNLIEEGSPVSELSSLLGTLGLGGSSYGSGMLGLGTILAEKLSSDSDNSDRIDKDMFASLIEILRLQMLMNTTSSIGDFD
ncbi:lytic transglycosylase domain-containing protein [Oribacterium sp. WCC10]|uniref:lytic transglycosylase domain-containing protein n=1 Tax=Oribacterium sp. WCC10 TaxID=1855343 RepID=UPI0008F3FCDB|nr:lytic transglycosylase domain-containing protein [Oribacterium sp. WCC10]SFG24366.1 Transglycosylase SLT domain-containing protein [Oribacterium sp. WCC10]